MPTRAGDVVVSLTDGARSEYLLWSVEVDQQQTPSAPAYVSTTHGREAALKLAQMMVRARRGHCRSVFLLEIGCTQP